MKIGKCFECDAVGEVQDHHVIPQSKGGTKTVPLCLKCHGLVHDKDLLKMSALAKEAKKRNKENGIVKRNRYVKKKLPRLTELNNILNKPIYRKIADVEPYPKKTVSEIALEVGCCTGTVSKYNKLIKERDAISEEQKERRQLDKEARREGFTSRWDKLTKSIQAVDCSKYMFIEKEVA